MMNKKRGLTGSVSCPTIEIPGRQITEIRNKRKTPVEPWWAKATKLI